MDEFNRGLILEWLGQVQMDDTLERVVPGGLERDLGKDLRREL